METKIREEGYYFVRGDNSEPWEISYWDDEQELWFCFDGSAYRNAVYDIVGEKVKLPE